MRFAYPWAFLIPVAILTLTWWKRRDLGAAPHPQVSVLKEIAPSLRLRLRRPVLWILSILALLNLGLAASRPQIIRVVDEPSSSRNLMFTLDISRSMSAEDFEFGGDYTSRIEGVKVVMGQFIKARKDDRIGVVVFGQNAYVQAPLTLDHHMVASQIQTLDVGLAGDGTAVGDGLGLSLKRMLDIPGEAKAIILMTDGVSNAGQVNPLKAAKVAADMGVKVHTIGIGSKKGVIRNGPMLFGPQRTVPADFDEATLRRMSDLTGGLYFHASSAEGLQKIYEEIDLLDKTDAESPMREIPQELFPEFLIAGLFCYLAYVLLANSYFMKLP